MNFQTQFLIVLAVVFFLLGIVGIFLKNAFFLIFPNIALWIIAALAIKYMSTFIKDEEKLGDKEKKRK